MAEENKLNDIVSLSKRRGFIYQGSEIYDGLAGTWDYGPLGVLLKENLKKIWVKQFVHDRDDMYQVDAAILMNPRVWEASGHVGGFADPLVEDSKTNKRYRADHILEDAGIEDVASMNVEEMNKAIKDNGVKSPDGNELSEIRQFNMMFKTQVGASEDESSVSYLRPETAQGIFVNFKNILDTFHPKLPFGIAQIGKAFRNEIAPRDFVFRSREFEQMEIEYFVKESEWEKHFETLREEMWKYIESIGLNKDSVSELEVGDEDRAHYSKRTIDFEFEYPFGKKELYGLAYRTDYDLSKHQEASKTKLEYLDTETNEKFTPHVIEPSLGVDRTVLAVLSDAYTVDEMNGEERVFLKLSPNVAPVKVAVFPLMKNKPELVEKAREIFSDLRKDIPEIMFDDNGNVGKRYRRQDEIGTPLCVTIDFDTLEDDSVTVRDRDTGEQERIAISDLLAYIKGRVA
jgi:glycyl-tRNA synthetase